MKRLIAAALLATLFGAVGARADAQPVGCGGYQTSAGTSVCQVDATTANAQLRIQYGFTALNPGTSSTNRVDLIDSAGHVRFSTGTLTAGGPLFAGGIDDGLPAGVYTCKLVSTGDPGLVAYSCVVV